MHIVYHIGAHCTDANRLVTSLRKDADKLDDLAVAVPDPSKYRKVLRDVSLKLQGQPAEEEAQEVVLAAALGESDPDRVVFANESFICIGARALDDGVLYAKSHKSTWIRSLFPTGQVDFALCIRNPATWIPALHKSFGGDSDVAAIMGNTDPLSLAWSNYITRLRDACPDSRIIVWCNEDSPLIWPEVLRAVTGLEATTTLTGDDDVLGEIMAPEGLTRMQGYVAAHPPANAAARREIASAFLDKFVIEDAIEEEIDVPGWSDDLIARITAAYDADVARIAAIEGVDLIQP